jgi:hypothetical protein
MKPLEVGDPVSRDLQHQALEGRLERHLLTPTSLKNLRPSSVGQVLKPLSDKDDILQEMLDAAGR